MTASIDAFVGLGSNLGEPESQVNKALNKLSALPLSRLRKTSSLYRSAPLEGMRQPDYINAVAQLETRLPPGALLEELLAIERQHGRRRGRRWAARTLDLDLLVYGDLKLATDKLTLPHPRIAERNFVLLPLSEIATELVIPGLGMVRHIPVDRSNPRIERLIKSSLP